MQVPSFFPRAIPSACQNSQPSLTTIAYSAKPLCCNYGESALITLPAPHHKMGYFPKHLFWSTYRYNCIFIYVIIGYNIIIVIISLELDHIVTQTNTRFPKCKNFAFFTHCRIPNAQQRTSLSDHILWECCEQRSHSKCPKQSAGLEGCCARCSNCGCYPRVCGKNCGKCLFS